MCGYNFDLDILNVVRDRKASPEKRTGKSQMPQPLKYFRINKLKLSYEQLKQKTCY